MQGLIPWITPCSDGPRLPAPAWCLLVSLHPTLPPAVPAGEDEEGKEELPPGGALRLPPPRPSSVAESDADALQARVRELQTQVSREGGRRRCGCRLPPPSTGRPASAAETHTDI